MAATSRPMRPVPIRPSRFPRSCGTRFRGQPPCRIARSACASCFATARISAIVCSATASAFAPGVFVTVMPRAAAAFRSTLSVPVPQMEMSFSFGHACITWSVKRVRPRMFTATPACLSRSINTAGSVASESYTRTSSILRSRSSAGVPAKAGGLSSGTTISIRTSHSSDASEADHCRCQFLGESHSRPVCVKRDWAADRVQALKKVQLQGTARSVGRGVLSTYVAAPLERWNATDGPFSAACYPWTGTLAWRPLGGVNGMPYFRQRRLLEIRADS